MTLIEELEKVKKLYEGLTEWDMSAGIDVAIGIVKKHSDWIPYKSGDVVEEYDEYYITMSDGTLRQSWYLDGTWKDSIDFEEYDSDEIIAYKEVPIIEPYKGE